MQIITKLNENDLHNCATEHDMFLADFDETYIYKDGRHKFRGKLRTPYTNENYRMHDPISGRKKGRNLPCWHGYRDFYTSVFKYDPDAKVISGSMDMEPIVYDGVHDFELKFPETAYVNKGSQMEPYHFINQCDHDH